MAGLAATLGAGTHLVGALALALPGRLIWRVTMLLHAPPPTKALPAAAGAGAIAALAGSTMRLRALRRGRLLPWLRWHEFSRRVCC